MKLKAAFILSVLFLAGCASDAMQTYVGKSVSDIALDAGVPSASFDMLDGRRAFQWNDSTVIYNPGHTVTKTYGGTTAYTNTYGAYASEQKCIYTFFARLRNGGKENMLSDWVIEGFKEPTLDCE